MADQRGAHDRDRGRDDNRYRQWAETRPKDTYYREEYGWIMSDADVEAEKGIKQQFDDNYKSAKASVKSDIKKMQTAAQTGRDKINSMYDKAISEMRASPVSVQTTKIRVVNNGSNIEATYTVPTAFAQQYANTKGLSTAWHNGYLNVDVRAKGGKIVGQEIHDSLRNAQQQTQAAIKKAQAQSQQALAVARENANKERQAELSAYDKAASAQVSGQTAVWNKQLSEISGQYDARLQQGKQQYDDFKKSYSDSVLGVDAGLLESKTTNVARGVENANKKV